MNSRQLRRIGFLSAVAVLVACGLWWFTPPGTPRDMRRVKLRNRRPDTVRLQAVREFHLTLNGVPVFEGPLELRVGEPIFAEGKLKLDPDRVPQHDDCEKVELRLGPPHASAATWDALWGNSSLFLRVIRLKTPGEAKIECRQELSSRNFQSGTYEGRFYYVAEDGEQDQDVRELLGKTQVIVTNPTGPGP